MNESNKELSLPEEPEDTSRRQFLKTSSGLTFTAIAATSLPMSMLLTGCEATYYRMTFINWSRNIHASNMLAAKIYSEGDAETVVQWAAENNYKVRPMGSMHSWMPLVITKGTSDKDKILLIDSSSLNSLEMLEAKPDYAVVSVGGGALVESLYRFLSNNRSVGGSPNGYAFQNTPATGDISVGGALAINGHGTGVTYNGSTESKHFNGSLSNTVLSLRAIVWNAGSSKYQAKTFHRDDLDGDVFLTHLGRLLITQVTMQAVPNFNLRCLSYTNILSQRMFHKDTNNNPFTISNLLDKAGRIEIIWFPFTDKPWLKVWQNSPTKPSGSKSTSGPYNYAFSDSIPLLGSELIKAIVNGAPHLVPNFGKLQHEIVNLGLNGLHNEYLDEGLINGSNIPNPNSNNLDNDIWGPAWHTLLYVRKTTLRVTENGYAIHVPRAEAQTVIHDFVQKYQQLAASYAQRGLYPMAGPIEIRITGLEETAGLKTRTGAEPKPPALSALTKSAANHPSVDTAIWLDLLTLPGMPASNELYTELEAWLFARYPTAQIRVEWSKGWGYTKAHGPWSNTDVIKHKIPEGLANAPRNFANTVRVMRAYDPKNIYSNSLLDRLLVG